MPAPHHPPSRCRIVARCACALVLVVIGAGCRLPAIDPSGESIFSGASTTVAPPHCPLVGHHHAAAPACAPPVAAAPALVVAPPPIVAVPVAPVTVPVAPPAPPRICAQPVSAPLPEKRGAELIVTPHRIVAPVCSEVVVAAGICGPDGYFITRQPIEWMLAPDGVGQIVQVGKESPAYASYLLRHSPNKVGINYVRAHTSTISQTIDRGTKNPADDVVLDKGQSWISVTSPTEGTSSVTVWAPNEHNWQNRKRTATIYWVDARWTFPPCATVRSGQKHLLATTITRSSGIPVSGWIVRYEVLDGPAASFASGQRAVEVRTDAAGRAAVDLLSREVTPGITRIGVQIIRPETGRGDLPQMVVGQTVTNVTWTTPGLQVLAAGPSSAMIGSTLSYQVQVLNSGDLPTRGATLNFNPPPGVTFLNSNPPAQPFGSTYKWQLGDLPPRGAAAFTINCRADRDADLAARFTATSSDGLTAQSDVRTRVFSPALKVNMTGPDAVEIGQQAQFRIEVINTGSTPLTNVTVTDNFDPGLVHVQRETSPIVNSLGTLAAGETRRFAVTFVVAQAGQLCHRLDVAADGNQTTSVRGCVTGVAPSQAAPPPPFVRPPAGAAPQLAVRVSGPRLQRVDEIAQYFIEVSNTGNAAATNVRIAAEYGVNLQPKDATRGSTVEPGRRVISWQIDSLPAGAVETRQINCLCLNPDDQATLQATVTGNGAAAQSAEAVTQIAPRDRPGAPAPGGPPPAAAPAGRLKLTIAPSSNPIQVGRNTTFQITLTNERAVADRDVAITITLPDGLQFAKMSSPSAEPGFRAGDRTLQLTPINSLRPGEELRYALEVTGIRPGPRQRVEVQVQSALNITGFQEAAEVTVNAGS